MNRWILNTLGIALILTLGVIGRGFWRWGSAAPDLAPTLTRMNATLDLIDRPCASVDAKGKLLPDGPICEIDQMIHDVRKITTSSGKQVEQTGQLINAATGNLNKAGDSVTELTEHLNKTADAATGLTVALTGDANEAKTTIAGFQPLVAAYTQSGNDLDALLKDHAIHDTLTDLQVTTQNIGGITADLRQVSDKETAEFLKPVPWWKWPFKRAGQFIDIGAAVARNIP